MNWLAECCFDWFHWDMVRQIWNKKAVWSIPDLLEGSGEWRLTNVHKHLIWIVDINPVLCGTYSLSHLFKSETQPSLFGDVEEGGCIIFIVQPTQNTKIYSTTWPIPNMQHKKYLCGDLDRKIEVLYSWPPKEQFILSSSLSIPLNCWYL